MPISVSRENTKLLNLGGGWIKAVYNTGLTRTEPTGAVDAEGQLILGADGKPATRQVPILQEVTLTQASIEQEAGVLLPKARIKAIVEAALRESVVAKPIELAGL